MACMTEEMKLIREQVSRFEKKVDKRHPRTKVSSKLANIEKENRQNFCSNQQPKHEEGMHRRGQNVKPFSQRNDQLVHGTASVLSDYV